MIRATLVYPISDVYTLTCVSSKIGETGGESHAGCKLVDCRSVTCRDNAHIISSYDDLKTP